MLSAGEPKTSNRAPDATHVLSGSWLVDPQASHARFVAGTLAGLMKASGRFRSLSGNLVVGQAYAGGAW